MKQKIAFLLATSATILVCGWMVADIALSAAMGGWTGMVYFHASEGAKDSTSPVGRVVRVFGGTPAEAAGIRATDSIRALDGVPIGSRRELQALAASRTLGDRLEVTFRHRGGTKDLRAVLVLASPFSARFIAGMVAGLALAGVFFALGLFVAWKRPDDRRARLFFAVCLVFGAGLVPMAVSQGGIPSQNGILPLPGALRASELFAFALLSASGFVTGPLLLHLALLFPHPRPWLARHPRALAWVYLPLLLGMAGVPLGLLVELGALLAPGVSRPALAALLAFVTGSAALAVVGGRLLPVWRDPSGSRTPAAWKRVLLSRPVWMSVAFVLAYTSLLGLAMALAGLLAADSLERLVGSVGAAGPFVLLMVGVGSGYPILACLSLFRGYRESEPDERRQVKWPVWGLFSASAANLVLALLGTVLSLWAGRELGLPAAVEQVLQVGQWLALAIIPVSFAMGILKYRLMDIDVIIRKTLVYAVASSLIIVAYLLLVAVVGAWLVQALEVKADGVIIGCTLVVAMLFVPLRNRVQHLVDRHVFRQRYSYPLVLDQLADDVAESTDPRHISDTFARRVTDAVGSRAVVVFARARNDAAYWASAAVGAPDEVVGQLKLSLAELAACTSGGSAVPLSLSSLTLSPDDEKKLRHVGAAWLVPFQWEGEVLGVVSVARKVSAEPMDEDDRRFLQAAAAELARAIHAIRARREAREGEDARDIQRALLPRSLPRIEGYGIAGAWQPAAAVSGDYYDVLQLSPRATAFCIADIAGKGMPAALLMSNLQASVKAFAGEAVRPRDLAARLNRTMCAHASGWRFATFFYARLDGPSGRLAYVNAGHNPPLLLRAGRSGVERLTEGGTGLGMFEGAEYREGSIDLRPGDRLLLFTDGVTEAMDPNGVEFGEPRLVDFLREHADRPLDEALEELIGAVLEHSAGNLHDDVTLLGLEAVGAAVLAPVPGSYCPPTTLQG